MLVKLLEIQRGMRGGMAAAQEVYLNPSHIISVTSDSAANESLLRESEHLGLPSGTSFSRITLQEGNSPRIIVVVGSPSEVYQKIKTKQVLKG